VGPGEFGNFVDFGFCDFVGEYTGNTGTFSVHMQHYLNSAGLLEVKHLLEDQNNELHGGVVVVMKQHFIAFGTLNLDSQLSFPSDMAH
jgi:hypothetical protein